VNLQISLISVESRPKDRVNLGISLISVESRPKDRVNLQISLVSVENLRIKKPSAEAKI
jgi:hypothetical protein